MRFVERAGGALRPVERTGVERSPAAVLAANEIGYKDVSVKVRVVRPARAVYEGYSDGALHGRVVRLLDPGARFRAREGVDEADGLRCGQREIESDVLDPTVPFRQDLSRQRVNASKQSPDLGLGGTARQAEHARAGAEPVRVRLDETIGAVRGRLHGLEVVLVAAVVDRLEAEHASTVAGQLPVASNG